MSVLRDLYLSALPWYHSLVRHPNQSTVCLYCATGPLAPHSWRSMMVHKGLIVYKATSSRILAGSRAGCYLCRLLVDLGVTDGPQVIVELQVDQDPENPVDHPADAQYLVVGARVAGHSDYKSMTYCMYTPAGTFHASAQTLVRFQNMQRKRIHTSSHSRFARITILFPQFVEGGTDVSTENYRYFHCSLN